MRTICAILTLLALYACATPGDHVDEAASDRAARIKNQM
jgi:hypothetical protein